jgi:hypothetical protein
MQNWVGSFLAMARVCCDWRALAATEKWRGLGRAIILRKSNYD